MSTTDPVRPTLNDVAAHAGVSRQTVSNVIRNPSVVLNDTRGRVEAAIAQLGYRPNLAARQMRTSRSQAIAVRIRPSADGINAVVLDRFVHALCSAAERASYHLVVFTAVDDADEITGYGHLDSTLNIDGYVVVGTHADDRRVEWLMEHKRPFVTFGRPWSLTAARPDHGGRPTSIGLSDGHSWVDVDGAAGTAAATEHLLRQGHRRIAFLGWEDSAGTGDDRESGWRRAMESAGLGADAVILRATDSLLDGGAMAAQLVRAHPDVTAAVCVSDSIAVGALRVAPELELVGFDDTATAQALDLSSVAQPYEEAARNCFAILHDQLTGAPPQTFTQLLLEPSLRPRSAHHPSRG